MSNCKENNVEDRLLWVKVQENDINAFDRLYRKYWELVYAAAFKRLADTDYAKDITQDIFLQLWIRREKVTIDNFPAYLLTSVKNNVLKWIAKEQKFIPVPELLSELEATRDGADAGVMLKEFMIAYHAVLKTLTPSQQQIFEMRFDQNLSTATIAEKLNISRKTVQNQLGKSLEILRESFPIMLLLTIFFNK